MSYRVIAMGIQEVLYEKKATSYSRGEFQTR